MINICPIIPNKFSKEKVACGFTTRKGGVSPSPFNSLNLGFNTADDSVNINKNHSIIREFLHIDTSQTALMEQVHSGNISVVNEGGLSPSTDGLITSKPNIMLGVLVADCIPLLLFDAKNNVIGAIHCGWRPIVHGIAEKALNIFAEEFGSDMSDVVAAMGPSAGQCCYEIGGEVAENLNPSSIIERDGKLYADLRAELCGNLLKSGINRGNIEIFPDCTICCEELYFSYRRDGMNSGRMMGYIMLKEK